MRKYLRKSLPDLKPYKVEPNAYKFKLDANESPFKMPDVVKEKLADWILQKENINEYPDNDCVVLREKLAEFWKVSKENIICTVGADQLIDYVMKTFIDEGDVIVTPSPTFSMYGISARICGGKVREVPLNRTVKAFSYDAKAIAEAANRLNAKAVIVCTPNNPTGNILEHGGEEYLAKNVRCPLIIDEAYGEFFSSSKSAVSLIRKHKNVLVLRTFSKAYGAAGVRLGYGIADSELIGMLELVRAPYNLSTLAQVTGSLILDNSAEFEKRVSFLKHERTRVFNALSDTPNVTAYVSSANFIYAESEFDLYSVLKARNVLVRSFGKTEEGKYAVRISIGGEEANDAVVEALGLVY